MWPNSKYEDINEILYHPSIVPGGGTEQVSSCKTATATDMFDVVRQKSD